MISKDKAGGTLLKRLIFAGILIAMGVILSPILRIPGMCPMQHFINIVGAVLLGPVYAAANAVLISFFRMALMGVNVLALTGSVFGAALSGILYKKTRSILLAFLGEVIGTGVIGAVVSYPALKATMGVLPGSWYYYIPWFVGGTLIGGSVAFVFLKALGKTGQLRKIQRGLGTFFSGASLPRVLSVAGSDSSGGAGIQADMKAVLSCGCYPMTAVTAVTAQNTTGVRRVEDLSSETIRAQIDAVFDDSPPAAVKIGMLSRPETIEAVAEALKGREVPIVLDPVMVATSGAGLLREESVGLLKSLLLPMCTVATPNMKEAEVLSGIEIHSEADMEAAARSIHSLGAQAVLIKGGHAVGHANDLLFDGERVTLFKGSRIPSENTHGTGCTLSSMIAARLAQGEKLETAVRRSKRMVRGAIRHGLDIGKGPGPVHALYQLTRAGATI